LYLFGDLLLLSKKDPEIGYDALVSAAGAGSTKILRKLLDESIPANSKATMVIAYARGDFCRKHNDYLPYWSTLGIRAYQRFLSFFFFFFALF
jgi:hypothetical protein